MTMARNVAAAVLILAGGLALHAAWAQLAGTKRIDLQRQDLSIPGREVIHVVSSSPRTLSKEGNRFTLVK